MKNLDFYEIEKKAKKLQESQRDIINQIIDKGFNKKETDFSHGYIRGVQDLLNEIFNLNSNTLNF